MTKNNERIFMNGRFVLSTDVARETLDWGQLGWISRPAMTEAQTLTVIEVTLEAGHGHNFHKHPDQEEVIYVMSGQIEQWLETDKQILKAGDSIFIKPDVIHASFNTGSETARLLVSLGPCTGPDGYELVDVADQAPWNALR
jgi:quercetin dioxygenase-like cupin family protein